MMNESQEEKISLIARRQERTVSSKKKIFFWDWMIIFWQRFVGVNLSKKNLRQRAVVSVSPDVLKKKRAQLLEHFEAEKRGLLADAGPVAESFFVRYVDPFIRFLKDNGATASTSWVVFEDIELASMSESDLREKIQVNLLQQIEGVVQEDIRFIHSFAQETLNESHIRAQYKDVALNEFSRAIFPLEEKLRYRVKIPESKKTLLELFLWKLEIDAARQHFLDQAISLIEDGVRLWQKTGAIISTTNPEELLLYIKNIFTSIDSDAKMPEALFELEEAAFCLTRMVETHPKLCMDGSVLSLTQQLRDEIDIFFDTAKRSGHYEVLVRIIEYLRYIEDTMIQMDSENSFGMAPPEVFP